MIVKGLTKKYGGEYALRDVSFTAQKGELTALLGPSGSGKSTLLKMIAGLLEPDEGTVTFEEPGSCAMIFQDALLFDHADVRHNMAFGLKKLGWSSAEIAEAVEKTAAMLKITNLLDRYPKTLSGGERQRVSIGRALIRKPSVLLMDEPFSSLDEGLRTELSNEITRITKELGLLTVSAVHDQKDALRNADRLLVLHDGELAEDSLKADFMAHPQDIRAARFMGECRFMIFDTEVKGSEGKYFRMQTGLKDGKYTALCRSADMEFAENGLEGTVVQCTFNNRYYETSVLTEAGRFCMDSEKGYNAGDSVSLRIRGPLNFYDTETYKRIAQ